LGEKHSSQAAVLVYIRPTLWRRRAGFCGL